VKKFQENVATRLTLSQAKAILDLCQDRRKLEATPADEFVGMWVV
jgi:hypothetical protein